MLRLLLTILAAAVILYLIFAVIVGGFTILTLFKMRLFDHQVEKELTRRRKLFGRRKVQ